MITRKFERKIQEHYGCLRTAVVFERMVYLFSKYPEGFCKFREPCKHPKYKKGDSWVEELNMSARTIDRTFAKFVNRHKTKREYDLADDKFNGKIFVSYTQKNENLTYYFINWEALVNFYDEIIGSRPSFLKRINMSLCDKNPN